MFVMFWKSLMSGYIVLSAEVESERDNAIGDFIQCQASIVPSNSRSRAEPVKPNMLKIVGFISVWCENVFYNVAYGKWRSCSIDRGEIAKVEGETLDVP